MISARVKTIAAKAGVERMNELRPGVYYVGQPNLGTIVERLSATAWRLTSTRGSSISRTLTRAFEIAQREAADMEAIVAKVDAMTDAELHEALRTPGLNYTLRQHVIAARIRRGIDRQPSSRTNPTH
ncbi:hypothetical protein [Amycolatopsis sp. NPDC051128]|uniref:hypothetical protein n=1 Tax=Amycolatopsis sp. NPDC051128 TaxID=3155412 RepID=UPI00343E3F8F